MKNETGAAEPGLNTVEAEGSGREVGSLQPAAATGQVATDDAFDGYGIKLESRRADVLAASAEKTLGQAPTSPYSIHPTRTDRTDREQSGNFAHGPYSKTVHSDRL